VHEAVVVVRAEQAACGVREVEAQRVVRRAAAPVAWRGGREEAAEERAPARAWHVQEELQRVLTHLLEGEPASPVRLKNAAAQSSDDDWMGTYRFWLCVAPALLTYKFRHQSFARAKVEHARLAA
jgi:hypothetical protein